MKMEYSTVTPALVTTSINLHYVTLFLLSLHSAFYIIYTCIKWSHVLCNPIY
jgi:hypothetical protein